MKNKTLIRIARTGRLEDFKTCALMMSGTDPWIKLGRDYKTCLQRSVAAPLREVYAAKENGKALGFIILQMTGTLKGYIQTVCVAPEARGRGIGTLLIRFAEKLIFKKSPNVFMCVSSFNRKARKLYEKLGYVKTGVLKNFILAGHDEILLRKTTGPSSKFSGTGARGSGRGTRR
jgi:ribosomal protein S18 acetylase RimI-like enzyme